MHQEVEPDVRDCVHSKIAVIGLGYAGLPLALRFVSKGFHVYGVDVDTVKLEALRRGASYLPDVTDNELREANHTSRFTVTDHFACVGEVDAVIICVPTPLTPYRNPELTFLQTAALEAGVYLREGLLVILESSTYPGTTREVLRPMLEKRSGMRAGVHFDLGYSPSGINPGLQPSQTGQLPKVVSGLTEKAVKAAYDLYSQVFDRVVPVSSPEVAEMANLLENAHRLVNISFMNEMAAICDTMRIDVWEVIDAAEMKSFGFAPYYPGPGVGGSSVVTDPLYLQWKAQKFGAMSKFIQLADEINRTVPAVIARKAAELLRPRESCKRPSVLLYGVAYKQDFNDVRESPALELIKLLRAKEINVAYHDPYVPHIDVNGEQMHSVHLTDQALRSTDCVILVTDPSVMPLKRILACAPLVFDTRGVTAILGKQPHVYRIGGGRAAW